MIALDPTLTSRSTSLFLFSLPLVHLIAIFLWHAVEKRIEALRASVKQA
jgi:hypothetical protein